MPAGLAFKVAVVAAMAFAGLLAGGISMFTPASNGAAFDHALAVVTAMLVSVKAAVAAAGLVAYRRED